MTFLRSSVIENEAMITSTFLVGRNCTRVGPVTGTMASFTPSASASRWAESTSKPVFWAFASTMP
ncbi:hypothetical protein CDEN61S_02507 [Castellaniella denitrificans]